MGLLLQNEDDHLIYEFTLISEHVDNKTVTEGWCQDCEMRIGQVEIRDKGDGNGVIFIPYFDTIAIKYRDDDEAGNDDFTGTSCVRCGLGHFYNAERVFVNDTSGFVSQLVELDGRV